MMIRAWLLFVLLALPLPAHAALVVVDRVAEITTTAGAGAITLAGATANHVSFNAAIGVGNTTYYAIIARAPVTQWEVGLGTLSGATTLTRTTPYSTWDGTTLCTTGCAALSFSAGTKDVFVTNPARTSGTTIAGTANQIIASAPAGEVTLSLPQAIATTSTPTFAKTTIVGTSNTAQLVIKANATQSTTSGLIDLQDSSGTSLLHIGSTDPTNVLIGSFAGSDSGAPGLSSVLIGYRAGKVNTGNYMTSVGAQSGDNNTTGTANSNFGFAAGLSTTTGSEATNIGFGAGQFNLTANYAVNVGTQAGWKNTAGDFVVNLGTQAGRFAHGPGVINIGFWAGYGGDYNTTTPPGAGVDDGSTTGSNTINIGYRAGANIKAASSSIVIGNQVHIPNANTNGQLVIGNLIFGNGLDGIESTISTGNIGIGIKNPTLAKLEVAGNVNVVQKTSGFLRLISDDNVPSLRFAYNAEPNTYYQSITGEGWGGPSTMSFKIFGSSGGTYTPLVLSGSGVGVAVSGPLLIAPLAKSATPATTGSYFNIATATFTDNNTAGSGTAASFAAYAFQAPTLAATNATVTTTNASTVYISGPPIAGTNETITNPWALRVATGNVDITSGTLIVSGVVTTSALKTSTALITATDGGATPAFTANMSGSTGGPVTAAQNGWVKMQDSAGATVWIPVWK